MAEQVNILASATGAGTSDEIAVSSLPVGVFAFGTLGSDTGNLQRKDSDGGWTNVYDSAGQVQLSATRPQCLIEGAGTYQVVFAARAAAIGVDMQVNTRR